MKNEFDYLNDVKMDFSCYKNETVSEKEIRIMKKNMNKSTRKNYKKILITAACIAALTITTAFASGLMDNIIKTISTGHNRFTQVDANAPQPLPNGLKGKIFDENGKPLEDITHADFGKIYDKDGNTITNEQYAKMLEEASGTLIKVSYDGYNPEETEKTFDTLDEAQNNTVFDIKTPNYLPEDYSLSRIYTYKNDDGSISGEYMTLVYKNSNSKEIIIHERILNENTAFEAGTDGTVKEITINGRTAVIMDGRSLNLETEDNVSVGIYSKGNISEAELIKISESIR